MLFFRKPSSTRRHRASSALRARLLIEALESRLVPYTTSGNVWPHPGLITLSFVPDGTIVGSNNNGYVRSNLFATFNGHSGWTTAAWQNQILKAAQTWAQQTNVNFAVVADNGATLGSGSDQQGDPNYGDIRFSGYNFGSSALAIAELPPPINNYSIAGDIAFNTGQPFNIGSTYDLYTVALHEIGHALGMDHSGLSSAVLYGTYLSSHSGLTSDDISGIRSIYTTNGPRTPDVYDAAGSNGSFAAAADVSAQINATSLTALVANLDITTASEVDYYTFTAPAGSKGTLTVTVQSNGLSLLAPTLTVYAANQTTVLGSASGAGHYGTTLTVTVQGVSAGQKFYVKVAGADTTAFGTGAYALTLNLGSGASPTVAPLNTQTANGSPISGGSTQAQGTQHGGLLGGLLGALLNPILGLVGNLGLAGGVFDLLSPPDPDSAAATSQPVVLAPATVSAAAPSPTLAGLRGAVTTPALALLPVTPATSLISTVVVAAAPPLFSQPPPQPLDSASRDRSDRTVLRTGSEEQPTPALPRNAEQAPAPPLPTLPEPDAEDQFQVQRWIQACDNFFAEPLPAVTAEAGEALIPTPAEGPEALQSPQAAALALAVVLGGHWGSQREEDQRRGERRASRPPCGAAPRA